MTRKSVHEYVRAEVRNRMTASPDVHSAHGRDLKEVTGHIAPCVVRRW